MGPISDYIEVALQFGFVTFFVVALPVAPLLAFVSNYLEIRTDGWKLLRQLQRPLLSAAEDIGVWLSLFQLMSTIAVITNGALICFTMVM